MNEFETLINSTIDFLTRFLGSNRPTVQAQYRVYMEELREFTATTPESPEWFHEGVDVLVTVASTLYSMGWTQTMIMELFELNRQDPLWHVKFLSLVESIAELRGRKRHTDERNRVWRQQLTRLGFKTVTSNDLADLLEKNIGYPGIVYTLSNTIHWLQQKGLLDAPEFVEAVGIVAQKNNSKTHETHYVDETTGKITRRTK